MATAIRPLVVRFVFLLIAIFSFFVVQNSVSLGDETKFRIVLHVRSRSNITNEIRSYLSRELRNLRGVTIVEDKDADYTIGVIVFPLQNKGGYNTGYAFSVVVTQSAGYFRVRDTIKGHCDETALRMLDAAAKDSVELVHHSLEVGSELEKTCHSLVADFDGAVLEPQRKIDQTLQDALKKP